MATTVVMTTFNGEKYLEQQLHSIAGQTTPPAELIVRDDASADATVRILREFQRTAGFDVVIDVNTKNVGFRENFMTATAKARGDIIAFCDQDDVWNSRKLECIERRFSAEDRPLLVHHNAELIDGTGRALGILFPPTRPEITRPVYYAPWSTPQGMTMAIDRRMFALLDLWPHSVDDHVANVRMSHDRYFYFLATCLGITAYLPEALASYRLHQSNAYGTSGGLKRRLKLDKLWWALTCFRNIEKRLVGLQSRREILLRVIEGDYAFDRSHATRYVEMIDRHVELLKVQSSIYREARFARRLQALRQLREHRAYGTHQEAKIEASNQMADVLGTCLGPSMVTGADRIKSALRGLRRTMK